jgi:exodeoxyribonuclease VII large subunit
LAPQARLASARQRVDELASRAILSLKHGLELRRAGVTALTQTLQAISPLQVLGRGYALVRLSADGALVRSLGQLSSRAGLDVQVSDGAFAAEVTEIPGGPSKP